MKKFIEVYKLYKTMHGYSDQYRFAWTPINDKGHGCYNVIELYDNELHLIDPNKVEIIK
jgi:hypothetical protein